MRKCVANPRWRVYLGRQISPDTAILRGTSRALIEHMKTRIIVTVMVAAAVAGFLASARPGRAAEGPAEPNRPPAEKKSAYKNVGVAEFEKLRSDRRHVVLDVRTAKEFAAGLIPGAVNIDVNAADFQEKISKLDRQKTYLVHCAAGVRSARACGKLGEVGFPSLYNLEGGFTAWVKAGHQPEK